GARVKRALLNALGRAQARRLDRAGFPGNDWLAGVTDPPCVADPDYLTRWLAALPGSVVELACHPGYHDRTLIGRDCDADDEYLRRRVDELQRLRETAYAEAVRRAGFPPTGPPPGGPPPPGVSGAGWPGGAGGQRGRGRRGKRRRPRPP